MVSSWFTLGDGGRRTTSLMFVWGGSGGTMVSSWVTLRGGGRSFLFVLGGSGGTVVSFWFTLGDGGCRTTSLMFVWGGSGGTMVSSWVTLRGGGCIVVPTLGGSGGASLPSCCSSMFFGSLGSKRISSSENCCGGIGGGRASVSIGLWGVHLLSTLISGEPGGKIDSMRT